MEHKESANNTDNISLDGLSKEFLLKEYHRLIEYKKITLNGYDTRFNIYLALASALLVILLPLFQRAEPEIVLNTVNAILIALLLLGVVTFVGLSSANTQSIHLERAIRHIQNYFISSDEMLKPLIYFQVTKTTVPGTDFKSMIIRGVTGGSPKSMILLINCAIATLLSIKIGNECKFLTNNVSQNIIFGTFILLLSILLHLIYTRIVYKANRIM
ncbi:MAG: hypothetical protein OEZ02_06340 [Anaerolineae bacterium]|nr:hypothetical protein [Anaerolineae bacterium]